MLRHHSRTATAAVIVVSVFAGVLWQPAPASEPGDWEITDLDAGRTEFPDIALDAGGNAIAVWVGNQRIRTASFDPATQAWSPAITLSSPSDSGWDPRVAVNAAGEAVAVWKGLTSNQPTYYVGLSRYSAATKTWGSPLVYPTDADWPSAVIDDQGNITVAWAQLVRHETGYCYYSYYSWYYYHCPSYPVYTIRSARYDATTAQWTLPVPLSGDYVSKPQIEIDPAGNVTLLWDSGGFVESRRWQSGGSSWSPVTRLSQGGSVSPEMIADRRGNVVATWHQTNGAIYAARFSADTAAWSPGAQIAPHSDIDPSLGVDELGNVTVAWTATGRLYSRSYLPSTNGWAAATEIASNVVPNSGRITVDPYGNATAIWLEPNQVLNSARRPAGGEWSPAETVTAFVGAPLIASDVVGNVFVLGGKPSAGLQAARWTAPLAAPAITRVQSSSGALTIEFTPPRVIEPTFAIQNYEYSLDDGLHWTARTPSSSARPIVLDQLTDGVAYLVRLRAVNIAGAGLASAAFTATPGLPVPTNLRAVTVAGAAVSLAWTTPSSSVQPTGYLVEGGLSPGSVLATLASRGTGTVFTFPAPVGVFYLRVRATLGQVESGQVQSEVSNEIVVNVGVMGPPSPPTNLLGHADGSTVALSWRNTFAGGAATGIILDVSGQATGPIPLPLTDRFTFAGVPPGTYTVAVRAVNASGSSGASNAVILTFPGSCAPPATPTGFAIAKNGNTIVLAWSPPASGAVPEEYVVFVSGSFNGSLRTSGLTLSGAASPGTYSLSVAATNACGTSATTPARTITIP